MELKILRTFQCVANCLNYSKAAEMLNFSQPTVSTQIQLLEEELGQKLFVHVGKKTYLTPQGKILKEDTDRLLNMADEIENKFKSMSNNVKVIKVAAHESFCNLNLPAVICQYLKETENVDVELHSDYTNKVIMNVRENIYDVGIISGEAEYAGIQSIPIDDTRVDIIVKKEIAEKYSLEEIVERFSYICYQADALQYSMDLGQVLRQSGITPGHVMRFASLFAIRQAVEEGLGYSVMSIDNIQQELEQKKISVITPDYVNVTSRTSAICLEDNVERPEVKAFIKKLKEAWIR